MATVTAPPKPQSHYIQFADPGHSWVKVSIAECRALGIYDEITRWSYKRGDFLYLEEDADVSTWVLAWREHGVDVAALVDCRHTDRSSRIRSYEPFPDES